MVVMAALVLGLSGAAWAQGGVLRVGLPSIPTSLDPATALEGPVSVIARQMFDTLVQYRETTSDIEPKTVHVNMGSRFHVIPLQRIRTIVTRKFIPESKLPKPAICKLHIQ